MKIQAALAFMIHYHRNSTDKCGQPFIGHPLRVMSYANSYDVSEDALVAALLHDTVEDTTATLRDVEDLFGRRVRDLVDLLTRRKFEAYREYVQRIASSGDVDAIRLKLADLRDNMDERRVIPEFRGEHERMVNHRYLWAKETLSAASGDMNEHLHKPDPQLVVDALARLGHGEAWKHAQALATYIARLETDKAARINASLILRENFDAEVARREAAEAHVEQLEAVVRAMLPVVWYVSRGRRYVDVGPYPDALARRVNAEALAALREDKP